jgi:glycosyltransferase involved in cell wall biosynthesis
MDTRKQPDDDIPLPSFSIVVETENLAVTEIAGLEESLDSLAAQQPSPAQANEVIVIESGDVPTPLRDRLTAKYPWVRFVRSESDLSYEGAKVEGARRATGEIVLYADSDCVYEPGWIRSMLAPFAAYSDLRLLAGETGIRGQGPYALAIALTFFFDGHSGRKDLYPLPTYYFNNVAFRRRFLLENPPFVDEPSYRGGIVLHIKELGRNGHTIWWQPRARAHHAPPKGLVTWFWRYLLMGSDNVAIRRAMMDRWQTTGRIAPVSRWTKLKRRLMANVLRKPIGVLYLPLALPIAALSVGLVYIGNRIARVRPNYIRDKFNRLERVAQSKSTAQIPVPPPADTFGSPMS